MTAIAVVTVCTRSRWDHVLAQLGTLERRHSDRPAHVLVWLDDDAPPEVPGATVLRLPPGEHGLRVGAARNIGADAAIAGGAELVVFLDADCIPGPRMLDRYVQAAAAHPGALLCGPVTYLPEGAPAHDDGALDAATAPHPARPSPPDGTMSVADASDYDLFWSLSFAIDAAGWRRIGGFCPDYQGYGAEDTDFARIARRAGIPLVWVGGAHAYHQHHPTSSPPWQHLDDILRNAAVFFTRWGEWPMGGWLRAFAAEGAIELVGGAWVRPTRALPR